MRKIPDLTLQLPVDSVELQLTLQLQSRVDSSAAKSTAELVRALERSLCLPVGRRRGEWYHPSKLLYFTAKEPTSSQSAQSICISDSSYANTKPDLTTLQHCTYTYPAALT